MFVIRKQQMKEFDKSMAQDFENLAYRYLLKTHPDAVLSMPEEDVRNSIRRGTERAGAYGIVAEYDVVRFIDLMHLLSDDFDTNPETSWVQPVLGDSNLHPSERMDLLHEKVSGNR